MHRVMQPTSWSEFRIVLSLQTGNPGWLGFLAVPSRAPGSCDRLRICGGAPRVCTWASWHLLPRGVVVSGFTRDIARVSVSLPCVTQSSHVSVRVWSPPRSGCHEWFWDERSSPGVCLDMLSRPLGGHPGVQLLGQKVPLIPAQLQERFGNRGTLWHETCFSQCPAAFLNETVLEWLPVRVHFQSSAGADVGNVVAVALLSEQLSGGLPPLSQGPQVQGSWFST